MYAVIRTGGRQFRAEIGRTIDVERLPYEVDESFDITDVLLVEDGENTVIGQPVVEGARVRVKVQEQGRGKKIIVFKYNPRTNYRRKKGHRQYFTRLLVEEIALQN